MNKNLEQLTKIIQEAVPDIECRNTSMLIKGVFTGLINYKNDTISLVDVLRAIEIKTCSGGEIEYSTYGDIFHIGKYAEMGHRGYYSKCFWDLKLPLHSQSQETVDFLLSILT